MKEFILEDIDRIVGIIKASLIQRSPNTYSNFSTKIQPPMCLWNSMRTSD